MRCINTTYPKVNNNYTMIVKTLIYWLLLPHNTAGLIYIFHRILNRRRHGDNFSCQRYAAENVSLRMDCILDTQVWKNWSIHYKNNSATFPKVSGSKINFIFNNPSLNVESMLISIISKNKKNFSESFGYFERSTMVVFHSRELINIFIYFLRM